VRHDGNKKGSLRYLNECNLFHTEMKVYCSSVGIQLMYLKMYYTNYCGKTIIPI